MRSFLLTLLASQSLLAADFPKPYNSEKDTAGPMPAEEVARTMELPPGFKCVVFASEPDVQQPIAMAWDPRGRLWIAENYTFAETPRRWDTSLQDRIVIFEDKDNDGKQDGRKVFWDKGSYLTSVELGYDGVWILNNGTLAFIADKNHDDVPDSEPEILLDGFDTKTIGHNIVNGLRWGPDGWLYGRHGITSTSSVGAPGTPEDKRIKMNCAIWRYHPTRKVLEAVCHGGTNSWGMDWDANGELFMINTVIGHLWHVIPGAYYDRMFGAHLNPHVYETIKQTADHVHWDTGAEKWSDIRKLGVTSKTSELGGGHAHVGMLIYQGGLWPKEYEGKLFTCNLHGNRINMDSLEREGCGFVGKHGKDFMQAKDKWFRGIDLSTGPDGNVFVIDWSDTGECHDTDGVHRTSGRIYKIVYGEGKPGPLNLSLYAKPTTREAREKLVFEAIRGNIWQSRTALQLMGEAWIAARPDLKSEAQFQQAKLDFAQLFQRDGIQIPNSASELLRDFWGARLTGHGQSFPQLDRILPLPEELRAQATCGFRPPSPWGSEIYPDLKACEDIYRQTKAQMKLDQSTWDSGATLLHGLYFATKEDPSGLVRLHLASALQRLPLEARYPIATALASHAEDANDRQQPLMIWYGIEPAVVAYPDKAIALALSSKIPTVRRLIVRRLTEEIEKTPAVMDALIAAAMKDENASAREDIVRGMSEALKGVSHVAKPKGWDEFVSRTGILPVPGASGVSPDLAKTQGQANTTSSASTGKMPVAPGTGGTPILRDLDLVFGSGRAIDELIALIKDNEGDASARRSALDSLLRNPKPDLFATVRGLINDKVLGLGARMGLAKFGDAQVAEALLNNWPKNNAEFQTANVNTLVSRPASALALLAAIDAHKIERDVITPFQARQLSSLGDAAVNKALAKTWGEVRDTPEAKKQELAKWKAVLTPEAIAKADASKGRLIYASVCAACHKMYGQGGTIAPDLTGGNRHDLNYLLENAIDPSALVPADYRVSVLKLKDGRTLTGIIPEQNERTITLQSQVERTVIERSNIASQEQLQVSLMPEGQFTALGEENVRNLIAYLMGNSQVEMPK